MSTVIHRGGLVLLAVVFLLWGTTAFAGGVTFGTTDVKVRLGNTSYTWNLGQKGLAPYNIGGYGSGAWAVWIGHDGELMFTDLYDNGRDMGPIEILQSGQHDVNSANVAWTNSSADPAGRAHVTYDSYNDTLHIESAYYISRPGWWGWGPVVVSGSYDVDRSSVAAALGTDVYIAFSTRNPDYKIYVARNVYGGDPAYWETPVFVGDGELISIVADSGGTVYVGYVSNGQFLYKSNPDGWTSATAVSGTYSVDNWFATLTVSDSGSLYFAWKSSSGLMWAYYSSGWQQSYIPSLGSGFWSPSLAVSPNGEVNMVWHAYDGGSQNVYFSRYKNSQWLQAPVLVRSNAGDANLAIGQDNKAMIMYGEYAGGWWTHLADFIREQ